MSCWKRSQCSHRLSSWTLGNKNRKKKKERGEREGLVCGKAHTIDQ